MSSYLQGKTKIRISDLQEAKRLKEKWVMLTSYDAVSAKIFDFAKIPCVLIGDSAAQAVFGYKSTIQLTMDELLPLAKAVSSSCSRALVVGDMPFGSYQESPAVALRNAIRFMKEASCHAIKLEGGKQYSEHVKLLTKSGIPVMGHVGFTPQSEHQLSGFKVQGRNDDATRQILADAKALQDSGAFAIVIELVPSEVGELLTKELKVPVIGIGAGPHCDAQVNVWNDMAGFTMPKINQQQGQPGARYLGDIDSSQGDTSKGPQTGLVLDRVPKFVKRYGNMSEVLFNAVTAFAEDVASGTYPAEEHCYK